MAAEEEDKEAAAMSALKSVHRRRSKSAELILERSVLRWSLVVVVRGCVCVVTKRFSFEFSSFFYTVVRICLRGGRGK